MNINKEIGKRIKKQRENLKISQEELAHLINKQTITIKRIENGEYKRLTLLLLTSIINALNSDFYEFIKGL